MSGSISIPLCFEVYVHGDVVIGECICRNETGEYFAIDLGGTSLKVVWVKLGAEPRAVVR